MTKRDDPDITRRIIEPPEKKDLGGLETIRPPLPPASKPDSGGGQGAGGGESGGGSGGQPGDQP